MTEEWISDNKLLNFVLWRIIFTQSSLRDRGKGVGGGGGGGAEKSRNVSLLNNALCPGSFGDTILNILGLIAFSITPFTILFLVKAECIRSWMWKSFRDQICDLLTVLKI